MTATGVFGWRMLKRHNGGGFTVVRVQYGYDTQRAAEDAIRVMKFQRRVPTGCVVFPDRRIEGSW